MKKTDSCIILFGVVAISFFTIKIVDGSNENVSKMDESEKQKFVQIAQNFAKAAYLFNKEQGLKQSEPKKGSVEEFRKSLGYKGNSVGVSAPGIYYARVKQKTEKVVYFRYEPGNLACFGHSEKNPMREKPKALWPKDKAVSLSASFIKNVLNWKDDEIAEPYANYDAIYLYGGRASPHWSVTWKRRASNGGFYYLEDTITCWISEKYGVFECLALKDTEWKGIKEADKISDRGAALKRALDEGKKSLEIAPILKSIKSGKVDPQKYTSDLRIIRPNDFRSYSDIHHFAIDIGNRSADGRLAWVFTFNWLHPDPKKQRDGEYEVWVYLDAVTLEYIGGNAIL